MTDQIDRLRQELARSYGDDAGGPTWFYALAKHILDNPQPHIDALVEAGVLRCISGEMSSLTSPDRYVVVDPHVHEWRVKFVAADPRWVGLLCATCGEAPKTTVPNRLPIEMPDA